MFDLVTVLISKQSFFQHHVWPVYQGKSYLHGIALPDFYIVSPFFYKRSKQARVPTFVWLFRDVATTAKGPGCDEGTNLRSRDFAVVPLMPTRALRLLKIRSFGEKSVKHFSSFTQRHNKRHYVTLKICIPLVVYRFFFAWRYITNRRDVM